MKLITRDSDYAIRSLIYMARGENGELFDVPGLVNKLGIPRPFLRKILQVLGKKGIVHSIKGMGGGFILNRAADNILIVDIVKIFQGPINLTECLLGKEICPNIKTCPIRARIKRIEGHIKDEIGDLTVADVIGEMKKRR